MKGSISGQRCAGRFGSRDLGSTPSPTKYERLMKRYIKESPIVQGQHLREEQPSVTGEIPVRVRLGCKSFAAVRRVSMNVTEALWLRVDTIATDDHRVRDGMGSAAPESRKGTPAMQ